MLIKLEEMAIDLIRNNLYNDYLSNCIDFIRIIVRCMCEHRLCARYYIGFTSRDQG